MDLNTPNAAAQRRSEDIALDLLKFVAVTTNLGHGAGSKTTGFAPPSTAKPEDQVDQILDLYARCRAAVEAPVAAAGSAK